MLAWMSVCLLCVCLWISKEDARSPGTGAEDGCELPGRFWELDPGFLEEQLVLLIIGPSLQLWQQSFKKSFESGKFQIQLKLQIQI